MSRSHLSDSELASFSADDLREVRVAVTAYGIILFGRIRLPPVPDAYIHFRAFTTGPDSEASFHSIHTEDKEDSGGGHTFRAIFTDTDPLEWFDT